jgi:hypothetical protein
MHQEKPKQEVKTLSIRIPLELYVTISQHTLDKDLPSLNAAIIDLVKTGIRASGEKNTIISEFIVEFVAPEKLKELMNAK